MYLVSCYSFPTGHNILPLLQLRYHQIMVTIITVGRQALSVESPDFLTQKTKPLNR